MKASTPVIETKNLCKQYDDGARSIQVLNQVNLQVARGEMIAITGVSGSGKSTLLHLLGTLDQPSGGQLLVQGFDVSNLNEKKKCKLRNKHLGFVYQAHHLLPEFNVLENVAMPLWIQGASIKAAQKQALALIQQVGLAHRATFHTGSLSGGEKQRVAIARALVTQPGCVLADEPTGNCDEDTATQLYNLLRSLNKKHATSFVIVTHDMQLASKMDASYHLHQKTLQRQ